MSKAAPDPHHPQTSLTANVLRHRCDATIFRFSTTDDVEPIEELIGQERALAAISFGTSIRKPGFNLYLMGTSGTGRHTAIRRFLERQAASEPAPDDWVYVNNFTFEHKPRSLRLPPGAALRLRDAMTELIDDLKTSVPAIFEQEDYRNRRRAIDESFEEKQNEAFEDLRKKAREESIAIMRTPMGFALAPMQNNQVIKPEVFNALPEEQRREIEKKIEGLQKELGDVLQRLPKLEKERRDRIREINAELAEFAVASSIDEIAGRFSEIEPIQTYLEEVRKDLIKNANLFLESTQDEAQQSLPFQKDVRRDDIRFQRYAVNVIVGSEVDGQQAGTSAKGAPIVFEDYPTLFNLIGRVEHTARFGALTTDFTLIKPGALHRANGGYLVLDAHKVLTQPFAWDTLKRCLRSGDISIISPGEQMSLVSTISLEPDPIPLSIKVALIGDRRLYFLLSALDPDFDELFKVEADFNEDIDRSENNTLLYGRLVATIVRGRELKPVDAGGVARIVEEAARLSDDAQKVSVRMGPLSDLLCEADHWADEAGRVVITAEDIMRTIDARRERAGRIRERSLEAITRDIALIDTDGEAIGQVNGLAVLSLGQFTFGRPSRITARVRMGTGKVVDIEREVELGGPLHSKGVLILSSFLSARYALDEPASLWASLVFEQSYSGVDGDSASSAELFALLSALAEVPIRQSFAVTGSVNQNGEIQPIGGVNDKIEGFFEVCQSRGLTGRQGVVIPKSNVQHLMLRDEVVEAVANGSFSVHAIATIDEGIEVLTGWTAGIRDADGHFPEGSINRLVEERLQKFARARGAFARRAVSENEAAGDRT